MKFFDAINERDRLRIKNASACAVECINWKGERWCVVFRDKAELANYRKMNKDWDIKINELA